VSSYTYPDNAPKVTDLVERFLEALVFNFKRLIKIGASPLKLKVGSFLSGMVAKEEISINIGESLGIDTINGFLSGTVTGIIIGTIHRYIPQIISPSVLIIFITIIAIIVIALNILKKRS